MSPEMQGGVLKRKRYRLIKLADQGVAESEVFAIADTTAKRAKIPSLEHPLYPGSRLVGYGYALSVHSLPGEDMVVKLSRGVFPEVNEPEYLEAAKADYARSMDHIAPFVVPTEFIRMEEMGSDGANVIFQRQLPPSKPDCILDPKDLPPKSKTALREFGEGLISLLEAHEWIPDLQLERTKDGKYKMWDVSIADGIPYVFDWTPIVDPFRLSPERTAIEIQQAKEILGEFIEDMSR
jgi:hypothetical protein